MKQRRTILSRTYLAFERKDNNLGFYHTFTTLSHFAPYLSIACH